MNLEELRSHLKDIKRQLSNGQAVVMVGAGFSKNAKPRDDLAGQPPEFPDLAQLQQIFITALDETSPDSTDAQWDTPLTARALEVTTDREELERRLCAAIPDQWYEPSDLHSNLLRLPWVDVYTTNYDTLLERARPSDPLYRVVTREQDLPGTKPRLIKLHGCMQDRTRLTITDKDIRQYSKSHGIFEHTIKQAMIENTLCLLGFSGNDDNFKVWTDWIVDHLGDSSPSIYNVGVGIDDLVATLQNQDGIVCLNMSTFSDVGDSDHAEGIRRFLRSIAPEETPPSPDSQHTPSSPTRWTLNDAFPEPPTDETTTCHLQEVVDTWREDRLAYPGWVVAPAKSRKELWSLTNAWTNYSPDPEALPGNLALEYAFELVWRMEKSLCPILNDQTDFLEGVISRYLSSADGQPPGGQGTHFNEEQGLISLPGHLQNMLFRICLAMLRYNREEGRASEWDATQTTIARVLPLLAPEDKARFYNERALFALHTLNLPELERIVSEWPADDALPFWEAKKAGLLAHMGHMDEADLILTKSLEAIRHRIKDSEDDCSYLSQEGLTLLLLRCVRWSTTFHSDRQYEEIRKWERECDKRWDALRPYQCHPWDETEELRKNLEKEALPASHPDPSPPFDIGYVRSTRYLAQPSQPLLEAYNFLRYREDAGLPLRYSATSAAQAAARIVATEPHWAITALIQAGVATEVDRVLNRVTLPGLTTSQADGLIEKCVTALNGLWQINYGNYEDLSLDYLLGQVLPEILSRVCTRASDQTKEQLLDVVMGIYQSNNRTKYRGIGTLITRLLRSFPVSQRTKAIPVLLKSRPLSNPTPIEEQEYIHPFHMLNLRKDLVIEPPEISEELIERTISDAASDNPPTRKWAVFTLGTLHNLGLLSPEECQDFGRALWRKVDADCLPADTDYYRHAFLGMPSPETVDPMQLFRAYVQQARFPIQPDPNKFTLTAPMTLCHEISGARHSLAWSSDEVESIIERLVQWWDADKAHLKRTESDEGFFSIAAEFKRRFSELTRTATSVIAPPFFPTPGSDTKQKISRLLKELSENGVPTMRLEVASLHVFPERRKEVLQKVKDGMASSSEETVIDALQALWILTERTGPDDDTDTKRHLNDVLDKAIQMLYWRREKGLPLAINTIADTIQVHPWVLEGNMGRILSGLDYLIEETAIPRPQRSSSQTGRNSMEVDIKLRVRQAAVHLAHVLYKHHTKQEKPIADVIMKWEALCRSDDEFADIKSGWTSPT